MTVSDEGINLIKQFEGLRLEAYKPVPTEKFYTIGFGHYGPDVSPKAKITEEKAEKLLREDIKTIEKRLNDMRINFIQRQFDALVSWIYNLGIGNFNCSTMRQNIIADFADIKITDELVRWVKAGGKPLLGLKRRRVAEANMFLGKEVYYIDEDNNIQTR